MMKKFLLAFACVMAVNAQAGIVIDNTVTGTTTNTFTASPTGNVSGLISQAGATYGERFQGQTVTNVGNFDAVSGTPTSLTLLANATIANNIGIIFFNANNVIYGDLSAGIGEGALSILLATGSDTLGFDVVGSDFGGQFVAEFFAADGSVIGSITQAATNSFFGFRTTGGSQIWGVTLTNTDDGGLAYDNFTFDGAAQVPEPATLALLGMGLFGLVAARRRKH